MCFCMKKAAAGATARGAGDAGRKPSTIPGESTTVPVEMAESSPSTPSSAGCPRPSAVQLLSANSLADSLGVAPAYKQEEAARWSSAAHVYESSRANSPFTKEPAIPSEDGNGALSSRQPSADHPHISRPPLSLEEIAAANRRRHAEEGGVVSSTEDGPLDLEAIAAIHELAHQVDSMSVSEILPRTPDLLFLNVKTREGHQYTLELTMKGWRIASSLSDCMNGDYTNFEMYTRYYADARELLGVLSPTEQSSFHQALTDKLRILEQSSGQKEAE